MTVGAAVPAQVLVATATPSPTATTTATSTVVPGHAKVLNDDTVSPGWLGFVVFLALATATVFLLRSFRRQLHKVPPRFDEPSPPASPPA